jgi:import inner membrane translocase subunit TIM22
MSRDPTSTDPASSSLDADAADVASTSSANDVFQPDAPIAVSTSTTPTTTDATTTTSTGATKKPTRTRRKTYDRVKLPSPEEVYQQDAMDNCAVKTVMSCVLGGALGGAMGVVFGAFEPMEVPAPDAPKISVTETIRRGVRSAGARSWSYAKGFAAFGALYAGSECAVEKARAAHDVANSAYAGCFTGGVMARKSGASGMAFGCATMAALSVAMDKFMDHH